MHFLLKWIYWGWAVQVENLQCYTSLPTGCVFQPYYPQLFTFCCKLAKFSTFCVNSANPNINQNIFNPSKFKKKLIDGSTLVKTTTSPHSNEVCAKLVCLMTKKNKKKRNKKKKEGFCIEESDHWNWSHLGATTRYMVRLTAFFRTAAEPRVKSLYCCQYLSNAATLPLESAWICVSTECIF